MDVFNEADVVISLIADTQGELYELAYRQGYDIEDFSNKYLASAFCKYEMDSVYSKYQTEFVEMCMDEILMEFKRRNISIKKQENREIYYSPFWIGATYRYMFFELKKFSVELANIIPFSELADICVELEECDWEETIVHLKKRYAMD